MNFKITPKVFGQPSDIQNEIPQKSAEDSASQGGVGIQDTMEVASRPDFFSGQPLNAQDLQQEQSYQINHTANTFLGNAHIIKMEAAENAKSAREEVRSVVAQNNFSKLIRTEFHLGDFQIALDAMHGQPQDYDQLQKIVQDLKNLLNSLPIPNLEKLKLQAEVSQLDQLSHQMSIQPQNPDQNFAEALQLLNHLRSELLPYTA